MSNTALIDDIVNQLAELSFKEIVAINNECFEEDEYQIIHKVDEQGLNNFFDTVGDFVVHYEEIKQLSEGEYFQLTQYGNIVKVKPCDDNTCLIVDSDKKPNFLSEIAVRLVENESLASEHGISIDGAYEEQDMTAFLSKNIEQISSYSFDCVTDLILSDIDKVTFIENQLINLNTYVIESIAELIIEDMCRDDFLSEVVDEIDESTLEEVTAEVIEDLGVDAEILHGESKVKTKTKL